MTTVAHLVLGLLFLGIGLAFGRSGLGRLKGPRRAEDVVWGQRHPIRRALLDPAAVLLGSSWDRHGAQTALLSGSLLVAIGVALIATA